MGRHEVRRELRKAREAMPRLGSRQALLATVVFAAVVAAVVVVLSFAVPGPGALFCWPSCRQPRCSSLCTLS